jgi:hypothetical protein
MTKNPEIVEKSSRLQKLKYKLKAIFSEFINGLKFIIRVINWSFKQFLKFLNWCLRNGVKFKDFLIKYRAQVTTLIILIWFLIFSQIIAAEQQQIYSNSSVIETNISGNEIAHTWNSNPLSDRIQMQKNVGNRESDLIESDLIGSDLKPFTLGDLETPIIPIVNKPEEGTKIKVEFYSFYGKFRLKKRPINILD